MLTNYPINTRGQENEQSTPPDAFRLQFMVVDLANTTHELQQRGIQFEQTFQPIRPGSAPHISSFCTPHGICIELWSDSTAAQTVQVEMKAAFESDDGRKSEEQDDEDEFEEDDSNDDSEREKNFDETDEDDEEEDEEFDRDDEGELEEEHEFDEQEGEEEEEEEEYDEFDIDEDEEEDEEEEDEDFDWDEDEDSYDDEDLASPGIAANKT
jgi:hypothetical protein